MDKWLAPAFGNLNNDFTDCCVTVGSKKYECHKVILASASAFFKSMFLSNFKESVSGEIHLPNVTPNIFEKFLKYVYTYNTDVLSENDNSTLIDLFVCGNQWLVPSITCECLKLLTKRAQLMKVDELIELYDFGHHFENNEFLDDISVILIAHHSGELLCDKALQLGFEIFKHYICKVTKQESQIRRYNLVKKYMEVNGLLATINPIEDDVQNIANITPIDLNSSSTEVRSSQIENTQTILNNNLNTAYGNILFNLIDYTGMSSTEFYEGPGKSPLFSYQFKYETIYKIFKNHLKAKSNFLPFMR